MTREEYLTLRNKNSIGDIIYNCYIELCNTEKSIPLDGNVFINWFNIWPLAQIISKQILQSYDNKFEILYLYSKEVNQQRFLISLS